MKQFKKHYHLLLLYICIGMVCQWLYARDKTVSVSENSMIDLIAPFESKKMMNGPIVFLLHSGQTIIGLSKLIPFHQRNPIELFH
jgi:hypothetical protein